jgi:hypothetical protein
MQKAKECLADASIGCLVEVFLDYKDFRKCPAFEKETS